MPLKAADRKEARGILMRWRDELSAKSIRQADYTFAVLSAVFSHGMDYGEIGTNPCARSGRLCNGTRIDRIWTSEQVAAFLQVVPLPGVAPVAKQQGQYVARALIARNQGRSIAAFRYRDYGLLATVGRSKAVAQFGRLHLSSPIAGVLWSVAHVHFLIGFRNRSIVALNWAWSYPAPEFRQILASRLV
jgi:hypothetical protein